MDLLSSYDDDAPHDASSAFAPVRSVNAGFAMHAPTRSRSCHFVAYILPLSHSLVLALSPSRLAHARDQ